MIIARDCDPLRRFAWSRFKRTFYDFCKPRATLCGDSRGRCSKTEDFLRFLQAAHDSLRRFARSRFKNSLASCPGNGLSACCLACASACRPASLLGYDPWSCFKRKLAQPPGKARGGGGRRNRERAVVLQAVPFLETA